MLKKKKLYFWLSLVLISSLVLLPLTAQAGWEQFHTDAAHVGATGDTSYPGVPSLIWMQGPWTVSGKTYEAVPSSSVTVGVYGSKTRVFVSCRLNTDKNEGLLMCLDASDGSQLWHAPVKGNNGSNDSWTSPTYHDGRVFIAGSKIYCYHADGENYSDNQKLIWDYDTTDGTVDNNPTKAWNGAVNGCPAISNNVVVVGDYTKPGEYHFIRESDGHPLGYSIPTDPDNNGYYCQGTPALAGGKAYLTAWTRNDAPYYRGHVWCVNLPSTGGNQGELTTLWSVYKDQNNNNLKSTCGSAVYYSDKLYVTTYNFDGVGDLYSLNPVNGNINWRSEVQRTDCTPSVETVNGNVYVYVCGGCRNYSNLQSHCYKDNGGSAELVWQTSTADEIGSYTCSPAVTTSDGKVFIGKSASGGLYFDYKGIFALNRSNGNKIWSFNHGGAAPAAYNGTIFTIAEGRVYAFGTSPNSKYDITDNDFSVGEKTYVTIEGTGDEANVRLSGSSGSQLDQSQTTSGGYTYQPGEVLDQSQTNYIGALNTDDNAQICWKNTGNPKFNKMRSQTFTAGETGKLTKVTLRLSKKGPPDDNLIVEIRNVTDSGAPDTTVLSSKPITPEEINATYSDYGEKEVTFTSPADVIKGKQYAIVLRMAAGDGGQGASKCYLWDYQSSDTDPYTGGKLWKTNVHNQEAWSSADNGTKYDFYFKTYITTANAKIYAKTNSDNQWRAQTFKAGVSGKLTKVTLKLRKLGSPPSNLVAQIRNVDAAGKPGGTVLGEKETAPGNIPADYGEVDITFSNLELASATSYAIVLWTPGPPYSDPDNCYLWDYNNTSNAYADGTLYKSNNGGMDWSTSGYAYDYYFKSYVESTGYSQQGTYTSTVKDTGENSTDYKYLFWHESKPEGTTVEFWLRSGNTSEPDVNWTDWISQTASGDEINASHDNHRYIQYKFTLTSNAAQDKTPRVDDVFITYTKP